VRVSFGFVSAQVPKTPAEKLLGLLFAQSTFSANSKIFRGLSERSAGERERV